MKTKIVLINWVDSFSCPGWQFSDDCKAEILYCQSIGFLVDENKDSICLALSKSNTKGAKPFCDLITIPKKAIIKIIKFRQTDKLDR